MGRSIGLPVDGALRFIPTRLNVQSNRPKLVRPDRNPGLSAHDFHQDPDAPVGRNLLDLGHKIRERPLGQCDLIAGLQDLRCDSGDPG